MKWYVLHVVSGSENKIKNIIQDQITKRNLTKYFTNIVVPVINLKEIKDGKQITVKKKIMPGYILINMVMNNITRNFVIAIPKVVGFLGGNDSPTVLSDKEISSIFTKLESEAKNINLSSTYIIGDKVKIIDGPFESFSGTIENVDAKNQKLKISVLIFGKSTPIELSFLQVQKNS